MSANGIESAPIIFLLHVPKTAGTSLISMFQSVMGPERCSIQDRPLSTTFLNDIRTQVEAGVRLFSGHVALDVILAARAQIQDMPSIIGTSIRDPFSHFYSLMVHSATVGLYGSPCSLEGTYADWLKTFAPSARQADRQITNITTQFLAGAIGEEINDRLFDIALERCDIFDFVINSDELAHSVVQLLRGVSGARPRNIPHLNSSSGLSRSVQVACLDQAEKLAAIIGYDIRLYQKLHAKFSAAFGPAQPIMIAESARRAGAQFRSGGVNMAAGESPLFSYDGDDIKLHPPEWGRSEFIYQDVAFRGFDKVFSCSFLVRDEKAQPVRFGIEISSPFRQISQHIVVSGGQKSSVAISLEGFQSPLSLIFSTEMVEGAPSNYASSWVVKPTIEDGRRREARD